MLQQIMERQLVSDGLWAFASRIVTTLVAVLNYGLLAHLISPADFAGYLLIFSFVIVGGHAATFGMHVNVVRLIAEALAKGQRGLARRMIWHSYIITCAGNTIAVGVLLLLAKTVLVRFEAASTTRDVVGLAACWVILQSLTLLTAEIFRGFSEIRLASIFTGPNGGVISSLLFAPSLICLWQSTEPTLSGVLILWICIRSLNLALALAALFALSRDPRFSMDPGHDYPGNDKSLYLAVDSLPYLASSITALVKLQVGLWIVALLCSPEDTAVFGAVSRLASVVTLPVLILSSVIRPRIVQLWTARRDRKLEALLRGMATICGLIAILCLGIIWIDGAKLMQMLFGENYAGGGRILVIITVGNCCFALAGMAGFALTMTGHRLTAMLVNVGSLLAIVVLGYLATRSFGIVGMAWLLCLTTVISTFMLETLTKRNLGVWSHMFFRISSFRKAVGLMSH